MRYRDKLTGHFVSRATWLRSRAHGGTRYTTVREKPIPRPSVKSTRRRPGRVPVKPAPRKRPAPTPQRPAKRPAPRKPTRKPPPERKPARRPPARKAPPPRRRVPAAPVLIRWRYQRAGERPTDIEVVISRGRVLGCRIGTGRGSYVYTDARSLAQLQNLFRTMPEAAVEHAQPARYAGWWDGEGSEDDDE